MARLSPSDGFPRAQLDSLLDGAPISLSPSECIPHAQLYSLVREGAPLSLRESVNSMILVQILAA